MWQCFASGVCVRSASVKCHRVVAFGMFGLGRSADSRELREFERRPSPQPPNKERGKYGELYDMTSHIRSSSMRY